jgi:HAD superfamily hydrolase (TIGR01509 family)
MIQGYDVSPEVEGVVRAVRENGYRTLICSNNFPARVSGLQEHFGFLDNFDAAVFSYEVGATKPSEIIFAELVKRSGVLPSEIAFADDNENNLAGANSIGMTAFVYSNFDKFIEDLRLLGVRI